MNLNFTNFGIFHLIKMNISINNLFIINCIRENTYNEYIEINLKNCDKKDFKPFTKFNKSININKEVGFFTISFSNLDIFNLSAENVICLNCSGSIIYIKESSLILINSHFKSNLAEFGGIIYSFGENINDKKNLIKNTTFINNYAEIGGALYIFLSYFSLENLKFHFLKANQKAGLNN